MTTNLENIAGEVSNTAWKSGGIPKAAEGLFLHSPWTGILGWLLKVGLPDLSSLKIRIRAS